ncbi:MAG TPA: tetratricopeptide repeat protein [Candidatus Binatia bacterium]
MKFLDRHHAIMAIAVLSAALGAAACETGSIYRGIPPRNVPERRPPPDYYPPPRELPPPSPPQSRAPLDRPLREEDLSETPRQAPRTPAPPMQEEYSRTPPPAPALPPAPSTPLPAPSPPPPLPDDSSLLAKITPSTPPQRAASLRLTDEGRKLLEAGDAQRALSRLEKTIAIDSTNPYGYYYLAKAQHALGRNQESLRFLDVAEPLFGSNSYWLAELFALRGENYRALGSYERAETNYTQALRFNSGNKIAADGLARVQSENGPAQR